jgi:hypothetical protein
MQVVRRFWMKNDVKGAMEAMAKLADHSVCIMPPITWHIIVHFSLVKLSDI